MAKEEPTSAAVPLALALDLFVRPRRRVVPFSLLRAVPDLLLGHRELPRALFNTRLVAQAVRVRVELPVHVLRLEMLEAICRRETGRETGRAWCEGDVMGVGG